MISKLTRKTLKEQAYQALRAMIVSHRFSPGKWINVEQLVQELGVSRTPIRLALKQLEEEKLGQAHTQPGGQPGGNDFAHGPGSLPRPWGPGRDGRPAGR